jgi:hypothetical protein
MHVREAVIVLFCTSIEAPDVRAFMPTNTAEKVLFEKIAEFTEDSKKIALWHVEMVVLLTCTEVTLLKYSAVSMFDCPTMFKFFTA